MTDPQRLLRDLAPDDVHRAFDDDDDDGGLRGVPTSAIVAAAADVIARPKVAPADSFVLHAPLELLARTLLLERAEPEQQDAGRRRLVWLAATYAAAGEELPAPVPARESTLVDLAARLRAALAAGDLDDIDIAASALAEHATPDQLRELLGPTIATSLAAAAHGSIFLSLLRRVSSAAAGPGRALRGLARDLGRHPDWQLRWFEDEDEPSPPASLADALLEVPMLGPVGNNFIQPIMSQAEESGIARKLLSGVVDGAPLDVATVRAELSRVAAWSMLQEPSGHAYGWTHCLTMPQAVLALAGDAVDPRAAVAVAATHVVGFRAAIGNVALVPRYEPAAAGGSDIDIGTDDLDAALVAGPAAAAAHGWHAAGPALASDLAGRAAAHHDAHYAKYTLACLDAAATDPAEERLYFAAAAFLAGYWSGKGDDGFLESRSAT